MSKSLSPSTVKDRISKDLLSLARVLNEDSSGVVINPDVLRSAANQVKSGSKKGSWSYQVADLQLKVDIPQNILPTRCGEWLDIGLDLDIGGQCVADGSTSITDLILNLKIRTNTQSNFCSWHFDRHITNKSEDRNSSAEAHPLYHFQHGGHAMKKFAESLGSMLLLPAPRLAFPPMDAILSLDFVLSNFSGLCWQQLRDEPTYLRLLKESQKKYWQPYLLRLASWWDDSSQKNDCTQLWPHLV